MSFRPRLLSLGLIAGAATLVWGATAQAGVLVASAPNCAAQPLSQPFLQWADPAQYTPVPGGNFESGAAGWSLSGGAQVVSGNETYFVGGAGDSSSLSLPDGSSATSPTMCVGIQNPDLRLFASNPGNPADSLQVSVNWLDGTGVTHTTTIGTLAAGGSWAPTVQDPVLVNLLALLPGNMTPVSFTFTPQGSGGSWQIDDVYVDPWGRT